MIIDKLPVDKFSIVNEFNLEQPFTKEVSDMIGYQNTNLIQSKEMFKCMKAYVLLKDNNYLEALKEVFKDATNQFKEMQIFKIDVKVGELKDENIFMIKLYGIFINK